MDWAGVPKFPPAGDGQGEVRWGSPESFFDTLPAVLEEVPPLPGEEAIYGQVRALLRAALARPELMATLRRAAAETEAAVIAALFKG